MAILSEDAVAYFALSEASNIKLFSDIGLGQILLRSCFS